MPTSHQLSFLPKLAQQAHLKEHGGSLSKGKRKTARPFNPKTAMHVVLKSSLARGKLSMLHPRTQKKVDHRVREVARKYRVRIYQYANAGNHLHILLNAQTRRDFQNFLRQVAGTIALLMMGGRKTKPSRFWDHLAYSRIVMWGRDFANSKIYLIRNLIEVTLGLKRDPRAKMNSWKLAAAPELRLPAHLKSHSPPDPRLLYRLFELEERARERPHFSND